MPNPPRWALLPPLSLSEQSYAQRDSSSSVSSSADPHPKQQHDTNTGRDDIGKAPGEEETAVASAAASVTTTETAQSTVLGRERSTTGTGEDEGRKNLSPLQGGTGEIENPNHSFESRADLLLRYLVRTSPTLQSCPLSRRKRRSAFRRRSLTTESSQFSRSMSKRRSNPAKKTKSSS